jgi:hypothetical protein
MPKMSSFMRYALVVAVMVAAACHKTPKVQPVPPAAEADR